MKSVLHAGVIAGIAAIAIAAAVPVALAMPAIPVALALALVAVGLLWHFTRNPLQPGEIAIWTVVAAFGALAMICGASSAEVGMGLLLANAGGIEMKAVQEAIDKATKTVKDTTDRMQQVLDQAINESKARETLTGKTVDELKASFGESKKAQDALKAAVDASMQEVRQEMDKIKGGRPGAGSEQKSWGQIVGESELYKAAQKSGARNMEPVEVGSFHKTRILSGDVQTTTGTVPYMGSVERAPFISGTERQLIVRNLIPVYQTEGAVVEFCRENVFTNAAAPQGGGSSPAETEGQPKPESSLTFTFTQAAIITIAHWIPASRQILADAKMLGSYIDQRLRYGVLLEEEEEVLNSTGTNGELNGLVNQATAYNRRATADSRLDTMLKAFLQVTLSDYAADGAVMSWVDWTELLLLKDTQGRYLFGDPSSMKAPSVWGRPVVPSNSMTVGNFLVGAFQLAAALWDREQATVRVSEHHENFFVKNMVALLAEERVALTVFRPAALISGSFGAVAGQPG